MEEVRPVRLRYTSEARQHIAAIHDYIAERNQAAAMRVIERIRAAISRLGEAPHIGRRGAVPGTQEWIVRGLPYIIVYQADPDRDELTVLDVFHGARDIARGPGPGE